MAKEYLIYSEKDFEEMVLKFKTFFIEQKSIGKHFTPVRIISKKLYRDKTPAQHKMYWAMIGELKKIFYKNGAILTSEQVHEFVKKESGFNQLITVSGRTYQVSKSIADKSDHVDLDEMNKLIDWIINFSIEIGEPIDVSTV